MGVIYFSYCNDLFFVFDPSGQAGTGIFVLGLNFKLHAMECDGIISYIFGKVTLAQFLRCHGSIVSTKRRTTDWHARVLEN